MRSRCFIGFLISVLGEPNIYQNLGRFTSTRIWGGLQEGGDVTWRMSDCEEWG